MEKVGRKKKHETLVKRKINMIYTPESRFSKSLENTLPFLPWIPIPRTVNRTANTWNAFPAPRSRNRLTLDRRVRIYSVFPLSEKNKNQSSPLLLSVSSEFLLLFSFYSLLNCPLAWFREVKGGGVPEWIWSSHPSERPLCPSLVMVYEALNLVTVCSLFSFLPLPLLSPYILYISSLFLSAG